MEQPVHMTLWCKRNNKVFSFTATIGNPKEVEDGDWVCEWSLGDLLTHQGRPLRNMNSMLAMLSAILFVARFLKICQKDGDLFFFDEALTEEITDIDELFEVA
jgi:hypothetical protein